MQETHDARAAGITRRLRRPAVRSTTIARPGERRQRAGIELRGTKGMYDPSPEVRKATARAMVGARDWVLVQCEAAGCEDPDTGQPRWFRSRLVNGKPERRACGTAHRLRLWRQDMRLKGYRQVTQDKRTGWLTPEGEFFANPSQPVRKPRPPSARGPGRPRKVVAPAPESAETAGAA